MSTIDKPIASQEINTPRQSESDIVPEIIENAQNSWVQKNKLSALSRPVKVEATVPDLNAADEALRSLGLVKENGQWYIDGPNREWFPDPINNDSIIINYGKNNDGSSDVGFCSQEEFSCIYADADHYDDGEILYVTASEKEKMTAFSATKHAVSEFAIVPAGTIIQTNEGPVVAQEGQLLMVNERSNSVYMADAKKIASRNIGDPMSPASIEVFDKLSEYVDGKASFTELDISFALADRDKAAYEGNELNDLHESFKKSAEVVDELENTLGRRINSLSFKERLAEAQQIIDEITADVQIGREEKMNKLSYVMARLLPKTNNHQHLKGSVPMETILALGRDHGFSEPDLRAVRDAYQKGANGFENLNEFNDSYGLIGRAIQTPSDYRRAVESIIEEATRSSQITAEIRCSVIGQRNEDGNPVTPEAAIENLLSAMDATTEKIGDDAPATSLVLLGYRGRDWKPEEVIAHAQLAVDFAKKYPTRKFGFDIAGPEDTGYGPSFFKEAYDHINAYNGAVKRGEVSGETIGITTHAGETPTFDEGRPGNESVEEVLAMGANRVGHGVQSVLNASTLNALKNSGATVEICGVCNITSIPINTRGLAIHPIQEFISRGIPVTICTDNDAICGTSITKEYAQFLFSGHNEVMNWKTVKQVAKQGIESSFVSKTDKARALKRLASRVRMIEHMVEQALEQINTKVGSGVLAVAQTTSNLAA